MKLQLLTCGLVLAQKARPTFSPEQSKKRYASIKNQYEEMTTHYFLTTAENEPLAKSAENRQTVVDRYNGRFGELLDELESLWIECGVNGDVLNSRSIRFDKSNWRRAFNQMRTGVNRIIDSELKCENCCTEAKKQERIKKLGLKVDKWAHNIGFQYCKKVNSEHEHCSKKNQITKEKMNKKVNGAQFMTDNGFPPKNKE
jgi:hypothetical protein